MGKIVQLQELSRPLEPDEEQRRVLLQAVSSYAHSFIENINNLPVFAAAEEESKKLFASPISDTPIGIDDALQLFDRCVVHPGVKPGSPGYLAYIPGGGLYASALGDFLAAITNKYAGVYFVAPGAARMGKMLLRWIAGFIGYPETAAGDITSGGSIAMLSAIVAAREAFALKAAEIPQAVIYLTEQTHHSATKAILIAGLQECNKRFISLDDRYRMQTGQLKASILQDKKQGLKPFLIIATAGTTDTGAVDPLPAIADIAEEHGLWLHTDGAYGGAFALCEEGRKALPGLHRCDSLVIDPHKGLFLPFGAGAVLVRDGSKLRQAFFDDAHYLQDGKFLASSDEFSPADLSPELSRHFRSLRLWLPLKLIGVAPFRAALSEKILLARYFYEKMKSVPGFELGPYPDLSIVIFRYIPKHGDANEFNEKLIQAVQQDGRIFLSSTTLNGKFTLRLAVLGFRTHLDTIGLAIKILRKKAALIENTI